MALPHSGIPAADPAPQDATVDDLTAATLTVTGASTLAAVTATSVSAPHSGLTGVTADQHHAQSHGVTGADHTASGLTAGHVLRATGPTTFAFGALADSDVPATIARDTEVTTAVSDHAALADPHTGYQKESEKGAVSGYASLDAGGTVPDAQIPATIARDAEVTSAVSAHEADTTSIHGITDTALLAVQAAYAAWTPALTATTTNPTLGTGGNAQGRYFQNGKHVVAYGSINFGTADTAAGSGSYRISMPITSRTPVNSDMNMIGQGYIFDASASALRPCIFHYVSTTTVGIRLTTDGSQVTDAAPWIWAASDVLIFHFDYEAA